jgi:hypothetical protein
MVKSSGFGSDFEVYEVESGGDSRILVNETVQADPPNLEAFFFAPEKIYNSH